MARFNLVCHGMMLLVESKDSIDILIPNVPEHSDCHGTPVPPNSPPPVRCRNNVRPLHPGQYTCSGLTSRGGRILDHISPLDHLVLDSKEVNVLWRQARVWIHMPKPDDIRLYRAVEVKNFDIFNGTPPHVAIARPRRMHDAVCLEYHDLAENTVVRIGDWFDATLTYRGMQSNLPGGEFYENVMTLCVFSQSRPSHASPHTTGLNDLLDVRTTGRPTNFALSRIGTCDGPPLSIDPQKKMTPCQLHNLSELDGSPHATDFTGCAGGFVGCRNPEDCQ